MGLPCPLDFLVGNFLETPKERADSWLWVAYDFLPEGCLCLFVAMHGEALAVDPLFLVFLSKLREVQLLRV